MKTEQEIRDWLDHQEGVAQIHSQSAQGFEDLKQRRRLTKKEREDLEMDLHIAAKASGAAEALRWVLQ